MHNIDYELLAMHFVASGLTFNKIEKETGVSRGTLYNVINGITKPSYTVACLINEVLELSGEDILAIYFPNDKQENELIF